MMKQGFIWFIVPEAGKAKTMVLARAFVEHHPMPKDRRAREYEIRGSRSNFSNLLLEQGIHSLVMTWASREDRVLMTYTPLIRIHHPTLTCRGLSPQHMNLGGCIHTVAVGSQLEHLSSFSVLLGPSSGTHFLSFPSQMLSSPLHPAKHHSSLFNERIPLLFATLDQPSPTGVGGKRPVHLDCALGVPTPNLIQTNSLSYLI